VFRLSIHYTSEAFVYRYGAFTWLMWVWFGCLVVSTVAVVCLERLVSEDISVARIFSGGAFFFLENADDLFIRRPQKSKHAQTTELTISTVQISAISSNNWTLALPGGALTTFPCKFTPPPIFHPPQGCTPWLRLCLKITVIRLVGCETHTRVLDLGIVSYMLRLLRASQSTGPCKFSDYFLLK